MATAALARPPIGGQLLPQPFATVTTDSSGERGGTDREALADGRRRVADADLPHRERVERLWGTLQDRLVSELRLAGATTAAGS